MNDERNSGNFDYPEGGFDGLIQAIVCTDVSGAMHCVISYTNTLHLVQIYDGQLALHSA